MIELAVREHDFDVAQSLAERHAFLSDTVLRRGWVRISGPYLRADSNALGAAVDVARRSHPRAAAFTGRVIARHLERPGDGERIALAAGEPEDAVALEWLAEVHAARGRWGAVSERLRTAERLGQGWADRFRARCATIFSFPMPEPELRRIRDRVAHWDSAAPAGARDPGALLTPHTRRYALGLIDARLGEYDGARAHAAALERLPAPPALEPTARLLARSVRAHVAWRRGRAAEALETLGDIASGVHIGLLQSPFLARDRERFLRAALLEELGRGGDALPWLEHGTVGPNEAFYVAPAQLRRARIHDGRGEADAARRHYAVFLDVWADADPLADGRVESARRRLAELTGEEAGLDGR